MPRGQTFATVEAIGTALPDVEVTTSYGQPALTVRGRKFVGMASHKSAEPNSLVVMMDIANRDLLVADDPDVYYLKEHYIPYPCVLVRLSRVHRDALHDIVTGTYRRASEKARTRRATTRRSTTGATVPRRRKP